MKIDQKQNARIMPPSNTTLTAEEMNQLTTEIQNVILEAGLTPSPDDLTQLTQAIKILAQRQIT